MDLDKLILVAAIVVIVLSGLIYSKIQSRQDYSAPKFIPGGDTLDGRKWDAKTVAKCRKRLDSVAGNSCQNDPVDTPGCSDFPYVFCDTQNGSKLVPTGTLSSEDACMYGGRLAYDSSQCDTPLVVNPGVLCGGNTHHDCLTCESTSQPPANPWNADAMCDK